VKEEATAAAMERRHLVAAAAQESTKATTDRLAAGLALLGRAREAPAATVVSTAVAGAAPAITVAAVLEGQAMRAGPGPDSILRAVVEEVLISARALRR
jgi:hypothetical protein